MVQEIIYTSAEKGLKQGSRGFCTVVSTAGMALNLAERLEAMSGYRHAFPVHDARGNLNPVCYSHVTTRLAGKVLNVISRVSDAGQDYSGRSNKLAHHIVVDSTSSFPAGPVRLLSQPGVVVDRWNGEVRNIAAREIKAINSGQPITLTAWKTVCGDEGWAGWIAEQLLKSPAPISVIFEPGTDTLGLVRDIIDLIPASQRWGITFSTYFTRLLAGTECQLRFVLNNTPEATSLRNDARARIVDLTRKLPPALGEGLVERARSGVIEPVPVSAATEPGEDSAAGTRERSQKFIDIEATRRSAPAISDRGLEDDLHRRTETDPFATKRSLLAPILAGMVLVIVICGIATVAFLLSGRNAGNDRFADLMRNSATTRVDPQADEGQRIQERQAEARRQREFAESQRKEAEERQRKAEFESARLQQENELAEKLKEQQRLADEIARAEEKKRLLQKEGPFMIIRSDDRWRDKYGQWRFAIPDPEKASQSDELPLLTWGIEPSIEFYQEASTVFENAEFEYSVKRSAEALDSWDLTCQRSGSKAVTLGTYRLRRVTPPPEDGTADVFLQFTWTLEAKRDVEASGLARWWPLLIRVGDRKAVFLQRDVIAHDVSVTWKSLTSSQEVQFAGEKASVGVPMGKSKGIQAQLEFTSANEKSVTVVPLSASAQNKSPRRDPSPDGVPDDGNISNIVFFPLIPPFQFQTEHDVADLDHFGTIKAAAHAMDNGGVSLSSKVGVKAMIPKIDFVKKLPNEKVLRALAEYVAAPDTLTSFPYEDAKRELETLQFVCKDHLSLAENWYEQSWNKIPPDKEWTPDFVDRLEDGLRKIRRDDRFKAIPKPPDMIDRLIAEKRATQAQMASKRAHMFEPSMNQLLKELLEQREALMLGYDAFEREFEAMDKHVQTCSIRFTIVGTVATPGCENGERLTIYFLDSR